MLYLPNPTLFGMVEALTAQDRRLDMPSKKPTAIDLRRGFTKALPIKAPPKPLVSNAMATVRNPLSRPTKVQQSVAARVGADAAAGAKIQLKPKGKKPARP
jgi:hypothetical protein